MILTFVSIAQSQLQIVINFYESLKYCCRETWKTYIIVYIMIFLKA